MKLAILGHSPLALEAALRFHLHGGAFTWYLDTGVEDFQSPEFGPHDFTSDLGLGILNEIGKSYAPKAFTWKEWKEGYEAPLVEFLKVHHEVREDEVVSVTKRFLGPHEEIKGRSRFFDLFRIIYKIDPRNFIEEQKESNRETYERLTEEFVNSLASSIEMYQDFDLVLDLRSDLRKSSMAITGRALGEGRKTSKVFYASEALMEARKLTPNPDQREIALIGSDTLAAEILIQLSDWIKEPRSRLFIVSHEEDPFVSTLKILRPESREKLLGLFSYMDQEFEVEKTEFMKKLREWQELDDFVQAKIPKPAEPIPRLNYFSGHNITAVDELIDKKRMFLTLEKPEFREGLKHPDNNHLDLKTLGVDLILVGHGKKDRSMIHLDQGEKGFFELTPDRMNVAYAWENDLSKLEGIENEIFKLFSPVDSH